MRASKAGTSNNQPKGSIILWLEAYHSGCWIDNRMIAGFYDWIESVIEVIELRPVE